MYTTISNLNSNTIEVSELQNTLEELETDLKDYREEWEEAFEEYDFAGSDYSNYETADEYAEEQIDMEFYNALKEADIEHISRDTTLIHDNHFQDYAQELCYDIGYVERDSFIENHVDWESVAEAIKVDYSCVEIDGNDFWFSG